MAKEKFKLGKPDEPCIVCGNPEAIYHHHYRKNVRPDLINDLRNVIVLCAWHHMNTPVAIHELGETRFIELNNLQYHMIEKGWQFDDYSQKWFLK